MSFKIFKNKKIGKQKLTVLIFTLFFLINISVSGGHFDPTDGPLNFLVAENLLEEGQFAISEKTKSGTDLGIDVKKIISFQLWNRAVAAYQENFGNNIPSEERTQWLWNYVETHAHYGPNYITIPFLIIPLYLLADIIGISSINFVALLFNSTIIALCSTIIFLIGAKIYKSEQTGFILALIFGLTSFIWPYITTLYARPLAILFMLITIYFLIHNKKNKTIALVAGITLGLTFMTHVLLILTIPGILAFGIYQFYKNKKQMTLFLIGFLIVLGMQLVSNELRFDSITSFGYSSDDLSNRGKNYIANIITTDVTKNGYIGFLFSPGLSIFVYLPVTILTPIGFYYMYKINRPLTLLLIYIVITTFLYLANSPNWNNNPYWGPHRYLLPIIPAIVLSIGSLIVNYKHTLRLKIGLIFLSTVGFVVNLIGNLVWIQYAFAFGWSQEGLWKIIEREREIFTWEPIFSPPIQSLKVLATNWVSTLNVDPNTLNYMKIGLYGCAYDLFIYCEFGIIPIVLLSVLIFVTSYMILSQIRKSKIENTVE